MDGVEGRVQLQIFSEVGKDSQSYELSHCFTHVQYPTTQWCIFLSDEVREISRFSVAPPTRVRPRPPRSISCARFEFVLINLHH